MKSTAAKRLLSGTEVRAEFLRTGKSISGWARAHGFSVRLTHEVISGRTPGRRGDAHKIAVLLGMKDGVITADGADAPDFNAPRDAAEREAA